MAKRRIIKETVKSILVSAQYMLLEPDRRENAFVEYTRYLCQEERYDAISQAKYWETMKCVDVNFEKQDTIFYSLENAKSFLNGEWGHIELEVVYEENK